MITLGGENDAGREVSVLLCAAARRVLSLIRTNREIRMLNRIGVLPLDWDRTDR